MLLSQGINVCMEYHRSNSRENTIRAYEFVLGRLCDQFKDREMDLSPLRRCSRSSIK